ncbi:unnamed protein product [Gadus morhua 'NCC']
MPEPGAAGVMRQSAGITQRAGPCNDEELADCVSGSFKIHLEIRPVERRGAGIRRVAPQPSTPESPPAESRALVKRLKAVMRRRDESREGNKKQKNSASTFETL